MNICIYILLYIYKYKYISGLHFWWIISFRNIFAPQISTNEGECRVQSLLHSPKICLCVRYSNIFINWYALHALHVYFYTTHWEEKRDKTKLHIFYLAFPLSRSYVINSPNLWSPVNILHFGMQKLFDRVRLACLSSLDICLLDIKIIYLNNCRQNPTQTVICMLCVRVCVLQANNLHSLWEVYTQSS